MPVVRDVQPSDMEAITEIYGHYVQNSAATFEIEAPDLPEMNRRAAAIASARLPYLVAESEGRVVGFAYAGPYRPRPAYQFTVEDSVYLDPGSTRQGIGSLLLGRLIEASQAAGVHQMIAIIGDSANTGSVQLHRRFGFRHVGTLQAVGRKFDRWVDTILMQRSL